MNAKIGLVTLCLSLTLLAGAPGHAQYKPPTEAQCREMVDSMLQSMKDSVAGKTDKQGADVVIERVERLVRENRRKGASECDSWAAIGKIVTGQ